MLDSALTPDQRSRPEFTSVWLAQAADQVIGQLDLVFPGLDGCFADLLGARSGRVIVTDICDPNRVRRLGPDGWAVLHETCAHARAADDCATNHDGPRTDACVLAGDLEERGRAHATVARTAGSGMGAGSQRASSAT